MSGKSLESASLLEWGVAQRALPGQGESGDQFVVRPFRDGALLAAVDGLGHGSEAAAAARTAVGVLTAAARARESVISLVRRCHEALLETRGAVMSLASFNAQDSTLTWLGIGNVEGVLARADPAVAPPRETLLLRGGVVGYQLPSLYASVIPVMPGDALVLATDGVRSDFGADLGHGEAPQAMADRLLAQYGKGTDDALVLVVQFAGRTQ